MPLNKTPRFTGNQLKIIASAAMLLDHIGAVIVGQGILPLSAARGDTYVWGLENSSWYMIYMVLRTIGRIAFYIYGFLLVEGYFHTSDWKRYAGRLGVFAVISEIPFDMMVYGVWIDWKNQNIYFTLLIGLLMIAALEQMGRRYQGDMQLLCQMGCILMACGVSTIMGTDYGFLGIFLIGIFYFMRKNHGFMCIISCLWMTIIQKVKAFIPGYMAAALLLYLYNGQRGRCSKKAVKWGFYAFYPLHMIVLCRIRKMLFT